MCGWQVKCVIPLLHKGHVAERFKDSSSFLYCRWWLEKWEGPRLLYCSGARLASKGAQSACDMYARFKSFRCQHRSTRAGSVADSCRYHVTRAYPDQFLGSTPIVGTQQHEQRETVSRAELITALQQARQNKVVSDFLRVRARNVEHIFVLT